MNIKMSIWEFGWTAGFGYHSIMIVCDQTVSCIMVQQGRYVDLSYLENMSGGSKSLVKEMVQIFIDQVPEFSAEMKEFLDKKDYQSLGLLAHKAKSSVAIMGMNNLADNLKEFELLTKEEKDVDQYPSYINDFEQSCQEAIQELKEMIKNL